MSKERDPFMLNIYGETRTHIGQFIEFTCPEVFRDEVEEFIKTKVRTIDIPTTHKVAVEHGGKGRYSRYNIEQYQYAGGGPDDYGNWAYIEILKVHDAPNNRQGCIIHENNSRVGAQFTEWETLEDATNAFNKYSNGNTTEEFPKQKGFIRLVKCGYLTPWFYAIGDQELIGDYAFPEGMQDDPVYTFGRKFIVYNKADVPQIKTCMGTMLMTRCDDREPAHSRRYRIIHFDDGSVWDEEEYYRSIIRYHQDPPRPVDQDELWVVEAIQEFHRLLAGTKESFTINFTDGSQFVGKFKPAKKSPCAEGDYSLVVYTKCGENRVGTVKGFKPTKEYPDIVTYVTDKMLKDKGKVVDRVEILKSTAKPNGKKWSGVFYNRNQTAQGDEGK